MDDGYTLGQLPCKSHAIDDLLLHCKEPDFSLHHPVSECVKLLDAGPTFSTIPFWHSVYAPETGPTVTQVPASNLKQLASVDSKKVQVQGQHRLTCKCNSSGT